MSFLAPLYLLGLAAVSLPLLFHLIRRTPRGRFSFSSLMFLDASPPRLTRRSRLDNILLLLLRAAALVLLAAAFARPFLRALANTSALNQERRKVAILVDTSASLQRADLWSQATREVDGVLDDLGPGDDVALVTFAGEHETQIRFDELIPADPSGKIARVRAAVRGLSPGWGGSHLGAALVAVADELDRERSASRDRSQVTRQIVLITDLQEGCSIDALQDYRWPDDVQLLLRPVKTPPATNAGLHPAIAAPGFDENRIRVRVSNSRESAGEQFQLAWETEPGRPADRPTRAYVPAGESRIVRVPTPAAGTSSSRLVLTGDDHAYDNTLHAVPLTQEQVQVVYLGADEADDPQGLRFYLERAFPETRRRSVQVLAAEPDQPLDEATLAAARMVVLRDGVPPRQVTALRDWLVQGGTLLVVLTDANSPGELATLLDVEALEIEDAVLDDFALLGQIDFSDPLFAPFADPRFNDFTTIHFWKHRRIGLPEDPPAKVLARFDDGDPALLEWSFERGRLLLLAAGWHPRDSQLSRSTKYVPLMHGLLDRAGESIVVSSIYEVGQPVTLPARGGQDADRSVRKPDGATLKLAADQQVFEETDLPGVYVLSAGGREQSFAVNVPARETATAPMSADLLQEQGVNLGTAVGRAERDARQRQMRDVELESRQKLWRWLIAAALGLLVLETGLAGYLARASVQPAGAV